MDEIECACGCGTKLTRVDSRKRERRYVAGHQNRNKTTAQLLAASAVMRQVVARRSHPWNKGQTYTIAKRSTYANKGSWMMATKRSFGDRCMRCGWNEATCDVHHVIARADGGTYSINNAIVLCPNCHRLVTTGILSPESILQIRQGAIPICHQV